MIEINNSAARENEFYGGSDIELLRLVSDSTGRDMRRYPQRFSDDEF